MVTTIPTGSNNAIVPSKRSATWDDYIEIRDRCEADPQDRSRIFFNKNLLWVKDMGWEGIIHSKVNSLFAMLVAFWFTVHPEQTAEFFGGCLLEKARFQSASPDFAVYVGEGIPQWQPGESRRINLNEWRVPDLVGEVADTTLAIDLDEMKQLYAAMGVPEYWVIDVQGRRVLAFRLQDDGYYEQCAESVALPGLKMELLEATLEQLQQGTNILAANWFMKQLG
jgi:Uma2 family endonuclease